jgi:hypothetical protein
VSDSAQMMQASFKTGKGTLINAKGDSEESFRMSVAVIHDHIQEILDLEQKIAAAGNVVSSGMTGATPPPPPPPSGDSFGGSFTNAAAPLSSIGQPMEPKTGTSAKGPWKGWFDARGKGFDQPKFVKQGTPEWNNFPA